ncbi:MAG: tail fiber domain-containing protein [Bacteroidota bacterium]
MKTIIYTSIFILSLIQIQLNAQVSIKPDSSSFEGKVSIHNTLEVNGLIYPETDGTAGQVLSTDGSGVLTWTTASGKDYSSAYQFVCNAPQTYFMTINSNNDSQQRNCGTLYDSGGPNGSYGNDEVDDFRLIFPDNALQVKIYLSNLDLESSDTLKIGDFVYHNNSASADTLIYSGLEHIDILFESNFTNNGQAYGGFEIRWEYLEYISGTSVGDEIIGFFYDVETQAVGGGVDQNNAWTSAGNRAVLFGYGSSAGNYGNAMGYFASAKHEASIAIGRESSADTSYAIAIGYESISDGANSIALGSETQVLERESIGIGSKNYITETFSIGIGYSNDVREEGSAAIGRDNLATGERSFVIGRQNNCMGEDTYMLGYSNGTSADRNTLVGYDNFSSSDDSHTLGIGLRTEAYRMTAVGSYNSSTGGNKALWFFNDPIFVVGNGQSSSSRSNALTILKSGNVGIGDDSPSEALVVNGAVQIGSTEKLEDEGTRLLGVNSTFVPSSNNSYDLGSSSLRWDDVYATNGTINTSDRRTKSHIKKLSYGLAEIMQLEPVRFRWKGDKSGEEKLGLIAQDLLKVLPEVVKTHDWVASSEADNAPLQKVKLDRLGVYYSDIIPVLIQGIQEQQDLIEAKEDRIADLEASLEALEDRLAQLEARYTNSTTPLSHRIAATDHLAQNQPNPFHTMTTIQYHVPQQTKSASIQITDAQGHVLAQIPIDETGDGQIELTADTLAAGIYYYTLFADGVVLERKAMQIVR